MIMLSCFILKMKPDFSKDVLISTFQSLMNRGQNFLKKYDAVIFDEAHQVKSFELKKIAERCINARYRIGLTGTIPKNRA